MVPCSSLTLTMFGRDEALLRGILIGGVRNGFLFEFKGVSVYFACSVGVRIVIVIFFF